MTRTGKEVQDTGPTAAAARPATQAPVIDLALDSRRRDMTAALW
jgi:hypothetical protein